MKKKKILITLWIITSIFGTLMVFSATSDSATAGSLASFRPLIKNAILITTMFIILRILFYDNTRIYRLLRKNSKLLFYIALASIVAVLVIGASLNNARMVIKIGPFNFQPLEFYKIAVIGYYASILSVDEYLSFEDIIKKSIVPIIGVVLIFLQPDLGGAVIVFGEMLLIGFISGRQTKWFALFTVALFVLTFLGLGLVLQGYQSERFEVWEDPFKTPATTGYQPIQSYIAISNGGLVGTGYLSSTQKSFLPVSESDYIFAIICEEFGILGAIFTLGMLLMIAFVMIAIGSESKGEYERVFAYGMALIILIQSSINIGGVVGLIPMTGVTLPFISNGLNSFIFMSLGLFQVVAIDNYNYQKNKKEKKRKKKNVRNK